jgi:Transcriptional regulator, AbiEi antitoxin/Protein of unknown function (DUF559)
VTDSDFLTGSSRNAPPDLRVAAIARRQHGLVTIAQLQAAGLNTAAVSKRVERKVLHRVGRGVYAVGHASLSREAQWMRAVLVAGEGTALGRLAAATLWQAWRRRAELAVISPRQSRLPYVHWTRHLDPRDVTKFRGIPVTTVPRTLVDLTEVLTAHQLANVIHEAAYRGRFSEPATRAAMERAKGRKNLQVLDRALCLNAAGSAGTKSWNEDRRLAEIEAAGLPEPLVNVHVEGIEVDLHWPDAKLCLEVDGPGHQRPRTRREDAARDEKLRAAGYEVMRASANPS